MINTIKKDKVFCCITDSQESFELLKKHFTTVLILAYFEFEKECIIETDVSDNVFVSVLFQYDDNRLLYPIAFFSCKHFPQKISYEIYDEKPLAIIRFFEEW